MAKTGNNTYKRQDGNWEGHNIKSDFNEKLSDDCLLQNQNFTEGTQLTFGEAAEQWLYNASIRIKTSTYASYLGVLSNRILPIMGGYKLQTFSSSLIDSFTKTMLSTGRKDGKGGLSPKTVRDTLVVVKSILDFAHKSNPSASDLKITYPKSGRKLIRVFSRHEQNALEQVLKDKPDKYKTGILLCLYTGLRIGEICALLWKNISLDMGVISVKQTLQRVKNMDKSASNKTMIIIDAPKTICSIRDIPLSSNMVRHLSAFYTGEDGYFLSDSRSGITEPRTLQNHFKNYVKTAGIASANYHCTRHTFATRCIEAGMDVKSLSEILGHSNVNITLNRYVHSSFEQKREGINQLEKLFE
ncbi:MAG: site-specific integrase [Clostridiales bacterium]|jgi:integrase|nr:site-specific integrase [Clostridiales bacterium]